VSPFGKKKSADLGPFPPRRSKREYPSMPRNGFNFLRESVVKARSLRDLHPEEEFLY
jgi:hypothetical protein